MKRNGNQGINGLGFDAVEIDGKWCLGRKQITGKDRKEDKCP